MVQALGFNRRWKLRDAWSYWGVKADYVRQSLLSGTATPNLVMEDVFTGKLLDPQLPIWQPALPEASPTN
jgi:hypothetical protein